MAAALQARHNLLRAIAQGLLAALSFCHQYGVAHCGLGSGTVVINTWNDKEVDRLLLKLDNFGLARLYPQPLETPAGRFHARQDTRKSGVLSCGCSALLCVWGVVQRFI